MEERRPSASSDESNWLTRRQLQVLRLLADGKSTDEIAGELGLSPTTVRNYIAGLLAALGAHNRLQAVVAASRAGLLDVLERSDYERHGV